MSSWNTPASCYTFGSVAFRSYGNPFRSGRAALVIVEGDRPNLCGHILLEAGGDYFHVGGISSDTIMTMSSVEYSSYLRSSGKRELKREQVSVPNPSGALTRLNHWLANPRWSYNLLQNNCAHFVLDVLKAGGVPDAWFSFCPVMVN